MRRSEGAPGGLAGRSGVTGLPALRQGGHVERRLVSRGTAAKRRRLRAAEVRGARPHRARQLDADAARRQGAAARAPARGRDRQDHGHERRCGRQRDHGAHQGALARGRLTQGRADAIPMTLERHDRSLEAGFRPRFDRLSRSRPRILSRWRYEAPPASGTLERGFAPPGVVEAAGSIAFARNREKGEGGPMPTWVPYPDFVNPGDNAWQLTAATLVGLMSVPGLAVLYGGVMQKRWSVNAMMMSFVAFALVLIVWVLY